MLDNYTCENQMTFEDIKERRPGEVPTFDNRAEAFGIVDKERRYAQILEVLTDFNRPLTAKEIAVAMNMRGYIPTSERNFTAPRLTEMMQKGIVEPYGKKKCSYTDKMVTVYQIRKGA